MDQDDLVGAEALAVQQRVEQRRVGAGIHDVRIADGSMDMNPQAALTSDIHGMAQQKIAEWLLGGLHVATACLEVASGLVLGQRLDVQSSSIGDDRLEGDRP